MHSSRGHSRGTTSWHGNPNRVQAKGKRVGSSDSSGGITERRGVPRLAIHWTILLHTGPFVCTSHHRIFYTGPCRGASERPLFVGTVRSTLCDTRGRSCSRAYVQNTWAACAHNVCLSQCSSNTCVLTMTVNRNRHRHLEPMLPNNRSVTPAPTRGAARPQLAGRRGWVTGARTGWCAACAPGGGDACGSPSWPCTQSHPLTALASDALYRVGACRSSSAPLTHLEP